MVRKSFNVRLSPDERTRLDKLARELGVTPADALRYSLKQVADLVLPRQAVAK